MPPKKRPSNDSDEDFVDAPASSSAARPKRRASSAARQVIKKTATTTSSDSDDIEDELYVDLNDSSTDDSDSEFEDSRSNRASTSSAPIPQKVTKAKNVIPAKPAKPSAGSKKATAEDREDEDVEEMDLEPVPSGDENDLGSEDEEENATSTNTQRRRNGVQGAVSRRRTSKKKMSALEVISEMHPELVTVWDDLRNMDAITPPTDFVQPPSILVKLLPFQIEGVYWLMNQEESRFNGGILADEMGMGKTIQMISLLVSKPDVKPNLILTPTVAILQWLAELKNRTAPDSLKVLVFHGANRETSAAKLANYDVVLSTYAIVESSWRKQQQGFKRQGKLVKEKSLIHSIDWGRVVLDEAHAIKDRSCSTARSVFNLKCRYKWSLSGTPLQNRVGELYSLIRFLNADYCGHISHSHFCWWNAEILKPIQKYGGAGDGLVAFHKLGLLLDRIMLRRTKVERADDLGLPPRVITVRRDVFNEAEEELYESLYSDSCRQFSTYVAANTANETAVCGICQDEAEDPIISKCKHVFCREDIKQYLLSVPEGQKVVCPTCFRVLSIDLTQDEYEPSSRAKEGVKSSIINYIDMSKWRSSTKIEALVEELSKLQKEDSTLKSIVFSQFVAFLDLIQWRLTRAGFTCVKLDGRMTPEGRQTVISTFTTDPTVTIFLVSLKAGGVALNLTEASLLDPWWNPAVEDQAFDRIHRLGQTRPIKITRLIIENSIESRILQLQEKKKMLFQSTVGKDIDALAKLSEEDLRFLFVFCRSRYLFINKPLFNDKVNGVLAGESSFLQKAIYQGVTTIGCTRLLDASGTFGCSSGITSGVLYGLYTDADVDAFVGIKDLLTKYATVIPFSLNTLGRLRDSGKLGGVIVIKDHPDFPLPKSHSPDLPFPNFKYSLYANSGSQPYPWNSNGNGLLNENYNFPIFLMSVSPNDPASQQSTGTIMEALNYNKDRSYSNYPLYSVEFDDFMNGAVDAKTCLRRGWCSPIGGKSSWGTFSYNMSKTDDRRRIIVSAPTDSNAFFRTSNARGAGATTSSYVALLASADALAAFQPDVIKLPKDIIFTLFSSEDFGFAGSQRFVKDLTEFKCLDTKKSDICKVPGTPCSNPCVPSTNFTDIVFDKIDAIIEFSHVVGAGLSNPLTSPTVFMHADDPQDAGTKALLDTFSGSTPVKNPANGQNVTLKFSNAIANNKLPPSSAMSFLAKKKIPAVVLADYSDKFNDPYFNSELDEGTSVTDANLAYLCGVATQAAQGIYVAAGGSKTAASRVNANCTLVSEMYSCFTRNLSCPYLTNYYPTPANFFVSSQYQGTFEFSDGVKYMPFYIQAILQNTVASRRAGPCVKANCDSAGNCDKKCDTFGPTFQCVADICIESQTQIHFAYPTGLEYNYDLNRFDVSDASKPTWVESQWSETTLRIRTFKSTSALYQSMQVATGVVLTGIGIYSTIFIRKVVNKRFKIE
ncbi:hypothetical protein HDU97_004638 [Phlyctochytrium planicorne]|nr:hypothetical protein HDU97_004638 [Phlyctochytrium planicorne]